MFQPTNESYIQSAIEATIDRHMGESEVEYVLRQGQPHREGGLSRSVRGLLSSLGYLLQGIGKRLERDNAPETVFPRQQTPPVEISPS